MKQEREPSTTRRVSLAEQGESAVVPVTSEVSSGAEVSRHAGSKAGHRGRRQVKIVFIAANARDGERLRLDEEYRTIEQAIRGARYRDVFQLIPKLAVRRSDVQDALLEHSPDVVHFACHGSTRAELLLLDDGPGAAPMSAEALAGLFKVLQDNVALVVFNACFASGQAEAIRRYAGLAVGMRAGIEDRSAIAFASGLYGALAYGRSVREGFELGVAAVAAVDPRQKDLPQLFVGEGGNAETTYLVGGSHSQRWPGRIGVLSGAVACGLVALGWLGLRPGHEELGLTGTGSGDPPDGTRGMDVQLAPWASTETPLAGSPVAGSDAPFVLETRLRGRRSQHGLPITLDEIRSGDVVLDGDHLQLSVRTSRDAYLYLAFCSQHAWEPRYRGLEVFPNQGGLRVIANQPTLAPARDGKIGEIVLDDQPGQEVLYVILSRSELSRADAGLANVLAAARRGRETTDCGGSFEAAVAGSRKGNTGRRTWDGGQRKTRAAQPDSHSGAEHAPTPDPGKPVVQIQRGAYVEFGGVQSGVEADPDGVVILRYELKHISAGE